MDATQLDSWRHYVNGASLPPSLSSMFIHRIGRTLMLIWLWSRRSKQKQSQVASMGLLGFSPLAIEVCTVVESSKVCVRIHRRGWMSSSLELLLVLLLLLLVLLFALSPVSTIIIIAQLKLWGQLGDTSDRSKDF